MSEPRCLVCEWELDECTCEGGATTQWAEAPNVAELAELRTALAKAQAENRTLAEAGAVTSEAFGKLEAELTALRRVAETAMEVADWNLLDEDIPENCKVDVAALRDALDALPRKEGTPP